MRVKQPNGQRSHAGPVMSSTPRDVVPALVDAIGSSRACCELKMLATGWSKEKPLSLLSLSPLVPRWEREFFVVRLTQGRGRPKKWEKKADVLTLG
jgi:hypothetical protein